MEIKGIDVSSYQSKPDWAKVSNSEIKFAILRIHQKSGTDSSFEHNYKGCKSNGILVGGYKYSYALTPAQAIDEAESVISVLGGRGMDFPIFYDLEWSQQRNLGKQAIENIAVAFLTRIKKAGYKVGIYCNLAGLLVIRLVIMALYRKDCVHLLVQAGSIPAEEKYPALVVTLTWMYSIRITKRRFLQ